MNRIVGIDLGTTNSLVATVDSGIPLVIADAEVDPPILDPGDLEDAGNHILEAHSLQPLSLELDRLTVMEAS